MLFSSFFRPKLRKPEAVYGLGPLPDTWGAARLIYEKQFTYPLDSPFGPGTPVKLTWRITQPPPPVVAQRAAFVTGLSGIPVGSFYSLPASLVSQPGDFKG